MKADMYVLWCRPQMRSVGEVMSIARDFTEGLQKALRMVNTSYKVCVRVHMHVILGCMLLTCICIYAFVLYSSVCV
jgi:hypothetical protein